MSEPLVVTKEAQTAVCFYRMRVYEVALRMAVLELSDSTLEAQALQERMLEAARMVITDSDGTAAA